jgi:hypothetical protein
MKYLLILLLPIACFADSKDDLVEHIKLRCDFLNEKIPLDVREDCVTDYVNSAVVGAGEVDLKQASDKRLKEAKKRREDDGQLQN